MCYVSIMFIDDESDLKELQELRKTNSLLKREVSELNQELNQLEQRTSNQHEELLELK